MRFIIDSFKLLFGKSEKRDALILTPEQRKKYRDQYWRIMIPTVLVSVVAVWSIGESIMIFFKSKSIIFLGLSMVFVKLFLEELTQTKYEIELIEERIGKRETRNVKQGRGLKDGKESTSSS